MGCIYIIPYDCDNYWAMDLGMYDAQIDTQIIQYPQTIPGSMEEKSVCFIDYKYNATCHQCFDFTNIIFSGDMVQADLRYTYQCENLPIMDLSFGSVSGEGVICGHSGYFYTPCNFTLSEPEKVVMKSVRGDNESRKLIS